MSGETKGLQEHQDLQGAKDEMMGEEIAASDACEKATIEEDSHAHHRLAEREETMVMTRQRG